MKKFLFFLMAIVTSITVSAQDVIVKNDNSTILCRIVEVNNNEVIYLKWSDLNGPRYVMDRSLVANINYQDGRQNKLNEQTSNAYAPGNQQTGAAQYNDNALFAMDFNKNATKQIKKYKTIGWTVGGICVAGGIVLLIEAMNDGYGIHYDYFRPECGVPGLILIAGGITTTTLCLIKANKIANEFKALSSAPIFQQQFNFGNGKSLCAGIDVIRDRQYKQTTLGLGLQYNF